MSLDDTTPIDGDGITTGVTVSELAAAIRQLKTNLNNGGLELISDSTGATKVIANDDGSVSIYTGSTETQKVYSSGIIDFPKQSACRATRSTAQSIPHATWTIVQYDTEEYDLQSEYDNVTNYRFTPKEDGYYHVDAALLSASATWAEGNVWHLNLFKNGTEWAYGYRTVVYSTITQFLDSKVSTDIYLTTSDYIDIRIYQNQGAAVNTFNSRTYNYLNIHKFA